VKSQLATLHSIVAFLHVRNFENNRGKLNFWDYVGPLLHTSDNMLRKIKRKEFNNVSDFPATIGNVLSEVGNSGHGDNLQLFRYGVISLFWLVPTLAVMKKCICEVFG
jgi:hypothetical protein